MPRTKRIAKPGSSNPPVTAVESVIDHVMQGVRTGLYVPGQRLTEADLSAATQVGRSPVREALRILAGEGAVQLAPNQGARLREMTPTDYANFVSAAGALMGIGLELAAVEPGTPENVKRLKAAFAAINANPTRQRLSDFMAAIYEFHIIVHEISGNGYLNKFMRRLHFERFMKELERLLTASDVKKYRARYDELFAALMRRDAKGTRRIWDQQATDILGVRSE